MTAGTINRTTLVATAVLGARRRRCARRAGTWRGAGRCRAAKATAPIDLTGYWVSVVNKDWRWRMVTPAKGDFFVRRHPDQRGGAASGETWDPAKDEAAGEPCRAFGAAGLMRVPGRLHITWQDDNTLRVETDAGMQTRLFHFGAAPPPRRRPTWQGDSVARWVGPLPAGRRTRRRRTRFARIDADHGPSAGRRLRQPRGGDEEPASRVSAQEWCALQCGDVMTEYRDLFKEPDGTDWLVITTTIVDSTYLQMPIRPARPSSASRTGRSGILLHAQPDGDPIMTMRIHRACALTPMRVTVVVLLVV